MISLLSALCIGGRLQTSESTFELVMAASWIGGAWHHCEALAVAADLGSARELKKHFLASCKWKGVD